MLRRLVALPGCDGRSSGFMGFGIVLHVIACQFTGSIIHRDNYTGLITGTVILGMCGQAYFEQTERLELGERNAFLRVSMYKMWP